MIRLFTFLIAVVLTSCAADSTTEDKVYYTSLTSIHSSYNSPVTIEVRVVGSNGNLIDGAQVTAENPDNQVLSLQCTDGVYSGYFSAPVTGTYTIHTRVIINGKDYIENHAVSHTILSEVPGVITMTDGNGDSVFAGREIDPSSVVYVNWNDIQAQVYILKIFENGSQLFSVNTPEVYYAFDSGVFENDKNYSITITGQCIDGDPFFMDSNFVSFSESTGSALYFGTN